MIVKVVKILSRKIAIQFGFDKCVVLKIKRGKQVHCGPVDFFTRWCSDRRGRWIKIEVSGNFRYTWFLSWPEDWAVV